MYMLLCIACIFNMSNLCTNADTERQKENKGIDFDAA